MNFSAWSPFGLLKYVKGKPIAQTLYESALKLFGQPDRSFSQEPASFADDVSFAAGRMFAYATDKVVRAGDQAFASGVYDMLPDMEDQYGLHPSATATIHERKQALAAAMLLAAGCARSALTTALSNLLGDNYVGIHITQPNERVQWPAALGDAPQNLQLPTVVRKLVRLQAPICISLGVAQPVVYLPIDPPPPATAGVHTLDVGDVLTIEPEIPGRAEPVKVTATGTISQGNNPPLLTFTGVFLNAHENQSWCTTMPFPLWTSSQREVVVIVKNGTGVNMDQRRRVHELLELIMPGVSTWDLVQENAVGSGVAGAFTLDDPTLGLLDVTPLSQVSPT